MPEANEQYLFAAVRVPNEVADTLAAIQRELAQQLKEHEQKHKLVSRRMFLVPIFDFKKAPMLSDEAIVLAFEKERAFLPKISLSAIRVQAWPSVENMEQIVAVVEDEGGQLNALRDVVAARAKLLGFDVTDDEWCPIIPLIRINPNQDACELEVESTFEPALSWSVNSIDVMGKQIDDQRARFQVRAMVNLNSESAIDGAHIADEEQRMRDEIAQQLLGRIEQRRVRLSETRRSKRSKNIRTEEESVGPQPVN